MTQPTLDQSHISLVTSVDQNGNPVSAGSATSVKSTAAAPTYTEGVTTNPLSTDLTGQLRVTDAGVLAYLASTTAPTFTNLVKGVTAQMTGTTSTAVTGMGAPGASTFNYITAVTVSNAHATVGTEVVLQDGSAGTTFWTFPAGPAYNGATIAFDPPLKQPTANTALFAKDLTTGAAVTVSVNGYTAV